MKCYICDTSFDDTKSGAGKFYMHLKKTHGVTKKEYVTKHDYENSAPTCLCGCGQEAHWSNRKGYSRYSKGHDKFEHREKRYIEEYGQPSCSSTTCSNPVEFYRAVPKQFCSMVCAGKNNGWSLDVTQESARRTLQLKYGVSNSFQIPHVADEIANKNLGIKRSPLSSETKQKLSQSSKQNWQNNREYIVFCVGEGVRGSKKHLESSSDRMKSNMQDESYLEHLWRGHKNRLSKLHQKARVDLGLSLKGFISEQRIGRYFVDELNPQTKEIIEINGDYVHANPKIYNPDDVIRLRGNSYTAEEKWNKDREKIQYLQNLGYNVTVIWESDLK
jgi:very-short-patch-repair endonuclease